MKTRIITLAIFAIMSLSFVACNDEEVKPKNDIEINDGSLMTLGGEGERM